MSDEDFEAHIDDLVNALKVELDKEISRDEIKDELSRFLEYGVPIEQAKQTLLKKYGGVAVFSGSSGGQRTLISDLKPNQSNVKILGHVIAINPKEITVKGENKTIYFGIIGDESGTIPFTAWSQINVEKGEVIEIDNAYTREWQGAVQLNLGDRVNVEKKEKDKLPKSAFEPKKSKLNELHSGMGSVDVTVKIIEINKRETTVGEEKKKIVSGVFADDTGKVQYTCWDDFNFKKGDTLNISGGYVKSWKGIPQLTFDSSADIKKLEKGKIKNVETGFKRMPIFKLVEKRGALDVEVEGTIIDIRQGSGYILRCPECNRVLQDKKCSIHGDVKGISDLRIKIIVDDGLGAVDSTLNKDLSEEILGINLEKAKKMDEHEISDLINKKLFAQKVILQGNALGDQFGTSIIAKNLSIVKVDVQKESEKIINELEGIL